VKRVPRETDEATLHRAVAGANLPVLVTTLAHLTGDLAPIRSAPVRPTPGGIGDVDGGLPDAERVRVGEMALELLVRVRDESLSLPPLPDRETLRELMSYCVGEPVADEYVPLAVEESGLSGRDERGAMWQRRPSEGALRRFRVVVIGAGMSGLLAAIRMEELGIPYVIVEKNTGVGGTWLENSYPGCRVDVANHYYSYSFEPYAWSDTYARRDQLKTYFEECARKYGLLSKIRFETEVLGARYDEERRRWSVRLRSRAGGESEIEAGAVISAAGMLNRPKLPEIHGLSRFAGPCFHSARWEHEHDLKGLRVGVIGTGASAMQFAPLVAREVGRLEVFQRTAQWAIPNPAYFRQVTPGKQWLLDHLPGYRSWYRFALFWNMADRVYSAFRIDPNWPDSATSINAVNEAMREHCTAHIRSEISDDPELLRKVLPDYPPLGKRMLMDNGWFRTLTRRNVELVTEPIREVVAHGVVTADGALHELDALVLATGFHAGHYLDPMEIVGRGGRNLRHEWGDDPRAYLGITVPGFPNLFCLYGPNTNPVVGSVIFNVECQVRYVMRCLTLLLGGGYAAIECRRDVHDEYNRRLDEEHEHLVWRHPRVHSYYNNAKGRVTTNLAWRLIDYWRWTQEPDPRDFVLAR
jgi:4-hydroxyacetophenone monooxygenase